VDEAVRSCGGDHCGGDTSPIDRTGRSSHDYGRPVISGRHQLEEEDGAPPRWACSRLRRLAQRVARFVVQPARRMQQGQAVAPLLGVAKSTRWHPLTGFNRQTDGEIGLGPCPGGRRTRRSRARPRSRGCRGGLSVRRSERWWSSSKPLVLRAGKRAAWMPARHRWPACRRRRRLRSHACSARMARRMRACAARCGP
jgi:hypothetical protein